MKDEASDTHTAFNYKPVQVVGLWLLPWSEGWDGNMSCDSISVPAAGSVLLAVEHSLCIVQPALLGEAVLLISWEQFWACLWAQPGGVLWSSSAICPGCSWENAGSAVLSNFILMWHIAKDVPSGLLLLLLLSWHFALFTIGFPCCLMFWIFT